MAVLFAAGIHYTLPKVVSAELVGGIFDCLDVDNSNELNFEEFYEAFKDMFDDSGAVVRIDA